MNPPIKGKSCPKPQKYSPLKSLRSRNHKEPVYKSKRPPTLLKSKSAFDVYTDEDIINQLSNTTYNNNFLKNVSTDSLRKAQLYTTLKNFPKKFSSKLTYSDYNKIVDNQMKFYRSTSESFRNTKTYKDILQSDQNFISLKEKNFIDKMKNKNKFYFGNYKNFENYLAKSQKESLYSGFGNDITLKVSLQNETVYNNPFESLGVLKTNNLIYDEVCKNSIKLQKNLYDKSIKAYESYRMKFKTKMPKIVVVDNLKKENLNVVATNEIDESDEDELKAKEERLHKEAEKHQNPKVKRKKSVITNKYKMFCYYKYPNKNVPECKELFTFNLLPNRNELILLGGMSSDKTSPLMWSLNIEKLEWSIVPFNNQISNVNKYGHTSVAYQNKIYVFGGRTKSYLTKIEDSAHLNGLEYFHLDEKLWYTPMLPSSSSPVKRRDHVGFLLSNTMIIHGGVNEYNEVLNDCYVLTLSSTLKWSKVEVNNNYPPPKAYGHAGTLCLPKSLPNSARFSIYKLPDGFFDGKSDVKYLKRLIGYYIFGGKYKCEDIKSVNNKLYLLSIGKRPVEFKEITNYQGTPPSPRYYHSMNYYENGNFIIIHGGRNDKLNETYALNDTFIFNVLTYEWMNIILYSYNSYNNEFKVINRCGHKAEIIENKLLIFGGMNSNNYIGSSLLIINLDFDYGKHRGPDEGLITKLSFQKTRKNLIFIDNNNNVTEFGIKITENNNKSEGDNNEVIDEKSDRIRKLALKNQIGVICPFFSLPEIK